MKRGFQNDYLDVRTTNGADDTLLNDLDFVTNAGVRYRVPQGSTTDGVSTPRIIRNLPGYDATGDNWLSGVLHDAAYRGTLLKQSADNTFERAMLTQAEADALILEAMTTQGVGVIRRNIIYRALRLFGFKAFNEDRRPNVPTGR